jgi:tRNA(fMet)-specific endonuclease VapC
MGLTTQDFLLDTNIAIALLMNETSTMNFARQAFNDKRKLFFSVITECEVYTGLKLEEQLLANKLFNTKRCIEVTSLIARAAGAIRKEQSLKGRKLKTPDALIIATALELKLVLVSRDHDMKFIENEYNIEFIIP